MASFQFTLYSTLGCHLCEVAQAVLVQSACIDEGVIGVCDISTEDALIERYGTSIPVLQHNASSKELNWPFDEADLNVFIRSLPVSCQSAS